MGIHLAAIGGKCGRWMMIDDDEGGGGWWITAVWPLEAGGGDKIERP